MRIRTSFLALSLALASGVRTRRVPLLPRQPQLARRGRARRGGDHRHPRPRPRLELRPRTPPDTAVGLARAATIVDSLRDATDGRVVLIDAGDIIQGNALAFVAARVSPADAAHPVMAAMNAMRYDAAAVGNHEFNYGVPFLERDGEPGALPAARRQRPTSRRHPRLPWRGPSSTAQA